MNKTRVEVLLNIGQWMDRQEYLNEKIEEMEREGWEYHDMKLELRDKFTCHMYVIFKRGVNND
jgi:hypothetical protein|nr:MAG TPA: protein of unknown function (DUF4177) [Caudoviricetes sp.]